MRRCSMYATFCTVRVKSIPTEATHATSALTEVAILKSTVSTKKPVARTPGAILGQRLRHRPRSRKRGQGRRGGRPRTPRKPAATAKRLGHGKGSMEVSTTSKLTRMRGSRNPERHCCFQPSPSFAFGRVFFQPFAKDPVQTALPAAPRGPQGFQDIRIQADGC